ncbi:hypothetical protein HYH03_015068 [Edaphochlamys debaryana]|uniref:Methyltransferase FkbM domain-containing protein n=1 Tax=Edaphochlamys debaryana TaxID=47281 RepID=A0A835XLH1_9CHLO|nr:hypothetical protein HYH03_015068 [Edaphochlamys debaryana]|eukprot:KAG2486243.1 hypothetical protein HYH03_015068 [Edaphochlamys debaryana]
MEERCTARRAYDCKDYTVPAFHKGYLVYSFELNPSNVQLCLNTFSSAGLAAGSDYTVIDVVPGQVPEIPADKRTGKHILFFKAGVSNRVGGANIQQGDVMTQASAAPAVGAGSQGSAPRPPPPVTPGSSGNVPLVRIDDVLPPDSRVYVFKSDTQGHEYGVYTGAEQLFKRGKVHMLALEFWPQGSRENGFEAKALLDFLYDNAFQCFDAATHGYDVLGRPSGHHAFTDFLDALPRSEDPIGAWEDLVCSRFDS